MTVVELIALLEQCNSEAEVYCLTYDTPNDEPLYIYPDGIDADEDDVAQIRVGLLEGAPLKTAKDVTRFRSSK